MKRGIWKKGRMRKWWKVAGEHRWTEEEGSRSKSVCCHGRLITISAFNLWPVLFAKSARLFVSGLSTMFHFQPFHDTTAEKKKRKATAHLKHDETWWCWKAFLCFPDRKCSNPSSSFHFSLSMRNASAVARGAFKQVTALYPPLSLEHFRNSTRRETHTQDNKAKQHPSDERWTDSNHVLGASCL